MDSVASVIATVDRLTIAGDHAGAVECLRSAIAHFPRSALIRVELSATLTRLNSHREATNVYFDVLQEGYRHAIIYNNLGACLTREGRIQEANVAYQVALDHDPNLPAAISNYLFSLSHLPETMASHLAAEHRRVCAVYSNSTYNRSPRAHKRRLKLGYIGSTFFRNSVTQFLLPVLRRHDADRFTVFCYQANEKTDEVTEVCRQAVEHWRDLSLLDDEAAADLIRKDDIDVLVDLDSHTAQNRLALFGRRCAPIQVSWLGYHHTTGLAEMDYHITDSLTDPRGVSEAQYSERLYRLDPVFLAFSPLDFAPEIADLPARKNGYVTFGCFNQLVKFCDPVIDLFSRILLANPNSRLVCKSAALADSKIAERHRHRFQQHGVAPERIICHGLTSQRNHLSLYNEVDIALDTFPYHGVTTTCEALWMGLPVVTLSSYLDRPRVGRSLLQAAGFPEWVADSPAGYVEIATSLAGNWETLSGIRTNMRTQLAKSPLMDIAGFTRRLETAFLEMSGE